MRMAFISDIHANLPALKAVLQDIRQQNIDMIYCLGDLVNQNVWNNEVVDLIRHFHIPVTQGNHDYGIGNNQSMFKFSYTSPEAYQWGLEAISYTLKDIRPAYQDYLRGLPQSIRIRQSFAGANFDILLTHGSPGDREHYLFHMAPDKDILPVMEAADADVLIVGHTHFPEYRIMQSKKGYKHFINAGSVGCPKDGSWLACYAIIELDDQKNMFNDPDALSVSFQRIDYNLDEVIKAIQNHNLPIYFASRLLAHT